MNALEPAKPQRRLDLAAIRARLDGLQGERYWRSLEELAGTAEFQNLVQREFPPGAAEWWDSLSRRGFLKMAAASLALAGLTACTKQPVQQILPYVKEPEGLMPGEPLFYATTMVLNGFGTGVLVKSREGHPIKVEGNPEHPASLGSSNIWMQASILDLYDPDRSQTVTHQGEISTWATFLSDLSQVTTEAERNQGAGLRFLTETVTSPTLAWQLQGLRQKFPKARWHQYEPILRDNIREGARLAFGEIVETHYRFDQAAIILALDSDFLYPHPAGLIHTRQFADGRRIAQKEQMNRLYVLESSPTVTGGMADHRLPISSSEVESLTVRIARELGTRIGPAGEALGRPDQWLSALLGDLQQHRGTSIVIAGECQPPRVHALAHLLNEFLGNVGKTVFYTASAEANPVIQLESLRELADEIKKGAVATLLILGGNPVFTAPVDLEFDQRVRSIQRTIHLGLERDETAAVCTWHIPQAHWLESWSDARAFDGTISLMQPLIAPLYHGKSFHEILGAMTRQQPIRSDYEIVREFWRSQNVWPDFETGWRRALHDGFIAGTVLPQKQVRVNVPNLEAEFSGRTRAASELELNLRPDPSVWDGRFANNGWLQECPRPITKLTWDNAVLISPALALRQGLLSGDLVDLTFQGRTLQAPVWILPGQAENSLTLHLGYGRSRVGRVGRAVGFNAYVLRTSTLPWFGTGATLRKTGRRHQLVATQTHHQIDSPERQVYRAGTLAQFLSDSDFVQKHSERPEDRETLYYPDEYAYSGYKWGMSIDLTTCIGCNACLVACQAENNIPVVGKDQVFRNREMFWIRVDTYFRGSLDAPEFHHMPVPCMHCEHAPCELVCPVAATVHDHEGLNLQIYNRCVGTRFCSNNCPYKVRRFNFYQYTQYHLANLKPMYNPDVTVRWRGVMEKCTYCVQRISAARVTAEKENRRIGDGELKTACQQACPAQAIIFGDLNDPNSRVAKLKQHPLDYSMLGQLNTRPRTTYLAKLRNLNPELEKGRHENASRL